MIKKTLCTVFSAMFLFVSIPTFAASSKYQKESKHFILDIEDKYLKGNISNKKLKKWLDKLDASYEALEELYGKPQSTKKINIKCDLDFDGAFVSHKNNSPSIVWGISSDACDANCMLKDIGENDFSLMMAIYRFFSCVDPSYTGWCFDMDTFPLLSDDYIHDKVLSGDPLWVKNICSKKASAISTDRYIVCKLIELKNKIGWEPFKRVFKAFNEGTFDSFQEFLHTCKVDEESSTVHCRYGNDFTNLDRFKSFMTEISNQGYADEVNKLFTPAQMDAIEDYLNQKEY